MSTVREMVRYGVKGGAGMIANVGLMTVLVEAAGLAPWLAAPLSTSALMLVGYLVIDRWVFPDAPETDTRRGHARQIAGYYLVIWTGKAANYALFLALIGVGLPYQVSWVVGAVAVFLGTFAGNRYLWHGSLA